MTRFDPTLIVRRLRIELRKGGVAYDEQFHSGVNILRGDNSSGKSTILNFIFYALGGNLTDWSDAALRCSTVWIEVDLNGMPATLTREISIKSSASMDIFGGDMKAALVAARAEWVRYPYTRSTDRESFSQAVFRLLHLPDVVNDASGTITMHQLLRLLYADQLTAIESIFKYEAFDPPIVRDAVGRLLAGAYDARLYLSEQRIRELGREFEDVSARLRSLYAVLGTSQEAMTLDWVVAQRRVLEQRREQLTTDIARLEKELFAAGREDQLTLRAQQEAYAEVQDLQAKLGAARQEQDRLAFAIADSDRFLGTLERKLQSLNDAGLTAAHIGDVIFDACPSCLAPVPETHDHRYACHLCKTPFDAERTKQRIVALINDTALQLKQSRALQQSRRDRLAKLEGETAALEQTWRQAADRLESVRSLPSGEIQEALREAHRQAGYLDREAEDLERRAEIIRLTDELSSQKADLNARISSLRSDIEDRKAAQATRLQRAYSEISDEVRALLRADLPRQDSFLKAQSIEFDFAGNSITVDGERYFSASSRAILKTAFFVGFWASALKDSNFRHPRFCMIDTIEDKGMEAARSQNFQRLVAALSAAANADHQILVATAMIAPELDSPDFTVGRYSTLSDPTLRV